MLMTTKTKNAAGIRTFANQVGTWPVLSTFVFFSIISIEIYRFFDFCMLQLRLCEIGVAISPKQRR